MSDQSTQAPSAQVVLDELLRTIHDALILAGSVIRGEPQTIAGVKSTPPLDDRLAAAHQIVEFAAPLAERLHTLQKTRAGGA